MATGARRAVCARCCTSFISSPAGVPGARVDGGSGAVRTFQRTFHAGRVVRQRRSGSAAADGGGKVDLPTALEKVERFRKVEPSNRFVTGNNVQPFPMNPYFRVVPPVSDALRERIFAQFSEDPEEWTPRKLAEEHGLSMLRVQAILKLKVLERKLAEQGAVMQTQLTKRMEKLLEAESVRSEEYQEAPRTRVSFRSTPVFLSVDDYDPTLPEVFASSRAGSGKDVSDLEKLTYEGSPTIKTKHKFVIHDISKTAVKRIARDPKE